MSLVSSNNEREAVGLEEIIDGDIPKADTVSATQGRGESLSVAARLLLFARGVAPNTVRGHLLLPVRLVGIGRSDASNRGHGQNSLNGRVESVHGTGKATMNAVDIVINDSRERQPIEDAIALFPNLFTNSAAEPRLRFNWKNINDSLNGIVKEIYCLALMKE
jgi:hypothetical protein